MAVGLVRCSPAPVKDEPILEFRLAAMRPAAFSPIRYREIPRTIPSANSRLVVI